ncbi:hypothetical protein MMC28_008628 [Mycoblastus sanguinarius]|nr:hypothetical protein [Mycoblastus sanguinarius]
MSPNHRPSIANRAATSKPPPSPIQSSPSTLIASSASITGTQPITIGPNAILQLRTRLVSTQGPITIGAGCIISERASIGLLKAPQDENTEYVAGVNFGPGVLVESGAVVEAASVGAYTVVEAGAKIGRGAVVGENCKICAMVEIAEGEVVGDFTVVYGNGWGERRVEKRGVGLDEMRKGLIEGQADVLRKGWNGK